MENVKKYKIVDMIELVLGMLCGICFVMFEIDSNMYNLMACIIFFLLMFINYLIMLTIKKDIISAGIIPIVCTVEKISYGRNSTTFSVKYEIDKKIYRNSISIWKLYDIMKEDDIQKIKEGTTFGAFAANDCPEIVVLNPGESKSDIWTIFLKLFLLVFCMGAIVLELIFNINWNI